MKTLIALFCLATSTSFARQGEDSFSRRHGEFQKELDRIEQRMKKAFGRMGEIDSLFRQFEKDFFDDDFFKKSAPLGFKGLHDRFDQLRFDYERDYNWSETKTHGVLTFKLEASKDNPLEIDVNQDRVAIKGEAKTTRKTRQDDRFEDFTSIQQFKKEIAVPPAYDCGSEKAEIVKLPGKIQVKCPKVKAGRSLRRDKSPLKTTPSDKKFVPLRPQSSDEII